MPEGLSPEDLIRLAFRYLGDDAASLLHYPSLLANRVAAGVRELPRLVSDARFWLRIGSVEAEQAVGAFLNGDPRLWEALRDHVRRAGAAVDEAAGIAAEAWGGDPKARAQVQKALLQAGEAGVAIAKGMVGGPLWVIALTDYSMPAGDRMALAALGVAAAGEVSSSVLSRFSQGSKGLGKILAAGEGAETMNRAIHVTRQKHLDFQAVSQTFIEKIASIKPGDEAAEVRKVWEGLDEAVKSRIQGAAVVVQSNRLGPILANRPEVGPEFRLAINLALGEFRERVENDFVRRMSSAMQTSPLVRTGPRMYENEAYAVQILDLGSKGAKIERSLADLMNVVPHDFDMNVHVLLKSTGRRLDLPGEVLQELLDQSVVQIAGQVGLKTSPNEARELSHRLQYAIQFRRRVDSLGEDFEEALQATNAFGMPMDRSAHSVRVANKAKEWFRLADEATTDDERIERLVEGARTVDKLYRTQVEARRAALHKMQASRVERWGGSTIQTKPDPALIREIELMRDLAALKTTPLEMVKRLERGDSSAEKVVDALVKEMNRLIDAWPQEGPP